MMKASELIPGDWVTVTEENNEFIGKVQAINAFTNYCIVKVGGDWHGGEHDVFIEDMQPVPLTSEIFEKSGFTLNEEENPILTIRVYSLDADDVAVIQRPKGGWKFMHGKETSNQQDLLFGDGKFVCTPIQYVHELQHALRLCGIEKEIEL